MEVASACATRGISVTVVDLDPPLRRLLGPFLSEAIVARAKSASVEFRRVHKPVELLGDPVGGARSDGDDLSADLVITCAGEVPATGWLHESGIADESGVGIDD